jgi:hypothetical protein
LTLAPVSAMAGARVTVWWPPLALINMGDAKTNGKLPNGNGAKVRKPKRAEIIHYDHEPTHLAEAAFWLQMGRSVNATAKHFRRTGETINKWRRDEDWDEFALEHGRHYRARYDRIVGKFMEKLEAWLENDSNELTTRDALTLLKLLQDEQGGKSDPNHAARVELTGNLATDSTFADITNNPEVAAAIQSAFAKLARDPCNASVDDKR